MICETSTRIAIFSSNGSLYNFYPNLPKISFIHKMSKNKAWRLKQRETEFFATLQHSIGDKEDNNNIKVDFLVLD